MTDSPDNIPQVVNKFTRKDIPIESIIEYRNQGLSYSEIGKLLNCDPSNVCRRLQSIQDDLDTLPHYKKHRADVIALKGKQILSHINDDKLKEASAYQLTGMYGILFDKERLQRDQSTANVASIHQDIAKIRALEMGIDSD